MIAVALKGIAGRKVRALLTAFAIVIGVSMVSGTFILTDTTEKSLTTLVDESTATSDAVVYEKEIVKSAAFSGVTAPASLLEEIRALPEVAAASGAILPQGDSHVADITGRDGTDATSESFARDWDPANPRLTAMPVGAFSPLELETGAWAKGPGEVVIDAGTATEQHFEAGDSIEITTFGEKRSYELAGTVSYAGDSLPPRPSLAVWDTKTAQTLLHREGRFDAISVAVADGTSPAELVRAIQPLLPADLQVVGVEQDIKDAKADFADSMTMVRAVLFGFGAIALLVGAFVIFNALSITVAQRTREFATLRTLGASRKQVMRSVVLEGLVLGLLASVIGLLLGIGVAKGMLTLIAAFGVDLPKASMVVASHTVTTSLIVGTVITLIASIVPAKRATRVPPIAAVREGATLPPTRLAEHSHKAGLVVTATSLVAIALGVFAGLGGAGVALLLSVGVLGLFAGIALLAPRLVMPLARVIGWPARRAGGVAGELAGANAVRNPGRTASTAATLMIGLTLVTVVAVVGASLSSATTQAVSDQVHAGYVVDGKADQPFAATGGDKLAELPGVTAASHVRSEAAIVQGKEDAITGIDPATIAHFYRFTWTEGSQRTLGELGTDGAIVTDSYAKEKHLKVGGRISVKTPTGEQHTLVVRGIYDEPTAQPLLSDVTVSQQAFDKAFEEPKNSFTFLDADAGAGPAIESAVKGLGDATFHTGADFPKDATGDMATLLAMLYVLLGFSVVVSLFGMINTMVLSVFERTREIGMLRTIGMTRRQARRMIRHESIITALIGAALGLGLGVFLAALITQAAPGWAVLTIPWPSLAAFTSVAVLAGIAAAVLPARRASRLDVLHALQYE